MKLMRVGAKGAEKPAVLAVDGTLKSKRASGLDLRAPFRQSPLP